MKSVLPDLLLECRMPSDLAAHNWVFIPNFVLWDICEILLAASVYLAFYLLQCFPFLLGKAVH